MPTTPPLGLPTSIQFTNIETNTFVEGEGGTLFRFDGSVVARIDGDTSGAFTIRGIEAFALQHDPDLPPGSLEWVTIRSVDGPGPIDVGGAKALGITVGFFVPLETQQAEFKAAAVVNAEGTNQPVLMAIPLDATVNLAGKIEITSIPTDVLLNGFAAGETADLRFQFQSTFLRDITGSFNCDTTTQEDFVASTLTFTIPPRVDANPSAVSVTLSTKCLLGTPAGEYSIAFPFISEDGTANAKIELSFKVNPDQPPKPVDNSIVWEETTQLSISVDPSVNAWHAGHLNGILLRSDATFVAAETGGIWAISIADPDAAAGCTTDDLDNPNFTSMAFGPDSPLQIYAACSSMKPGANPGTGLFAGGFETWSPVFIVDQFNNPLLTDDILGILVLPIHRALLLATQRGVFLSILSSAARPTFSLVQSLPAGGYSGICLGPQESVAVARSGPPGGIFLGNWSGNELVFAPAQMIPDGSRPNGDIDLTQVGRTSLASCGSDPSTMYAVLSGLDLRMYRILRSDSGGANWRPVFNLADRVAQQRTAPLAPDNDQNDMAGKQGDYNNCIAVGFHDSGEVGIGWENGPWLTSNASDVLSRWTLAYEDVNSPHVHGDLHAVLFDPGDASGNTIYSCSDGGLIVTTDRAGLAGYQSRLGKHIRNLQFYSGVPPGEKGAKGERGGGLTASPTIPGLIAGPTQDNGNLFCDLESSDNAPWQIMEGGDGVVLRFLSNGLLLSVSPNTNLTPPRPGQLSVWNGTRFDQVTNIPDASLNAVALTIQGDVQSVPNPTFALPPPDSQKTMHALAATQNAGGELRIVYGLFTDGTIQNAEWRLIGTLPLAPGDAISSVASLTGHQVFAGTDQGRIFSFAPFQDPFELVVSPADKGRVHDITVVREDDTLAFALYDGPNTRAILQTNFFNWDPLGSNDNVARGMNLDRTENFIAMTIDRVTSPPTLYACTDNRVFVSRDGGDTWLLANKDLPSRVHCTSFAIGVARPSGRYLYLGTYGRSVWQAKI